MGRELTMRLHAEALALGFDAAGITTPGRIGEAGARLGAFLAAGRHGDMEWMAAHADRRADPRVLWAQARSVIMLGTSYAPEDGADPLAILSERTRGAISIYAKGKDYHDIVKGRLKRLARWLQRETGGDVKVFVDTAPLMEKPLAAAAGLGWQGKHTNLVSRTHGSWLFLGAILTTAVLAPDPPGGDRCGSCRRCLDICPTRAFPAPYQLDARRCIAYLTIEHKGHIAHELREAIGNRVFGCDDCLAVCPWNKFAVASREARFGGRVETDNPPLGELLELDDATFRARFAGTPVKRTGRDRFVRNVLIAAGNSGQTELVGCVEPLIVDSSPLVRAMAIWALVRLVTRARMVELHRLFAAKEHDGAVVDEWNAAIAP